MAPENFPLPFRNEENEKILVPPGKFLFAFESSIDPNFVVKELKDPEPRKEAEMYIRSMRAFYVQLRSMFKDQIPQTTFSLVNVGEDKKKGTMSNIKIVQDRITGGLPSRQLLEAHPEYEKTITEFFEKVLDYYIRSFDLKQRKGNVIDTSEGNFMIGHSHFDELNKLYYIDSQHSIVYTEIDKAIKFFMEDLDHFNITSPAIENDLRIMSALEQASS